MLLDNLITHLQELKEITGGKTNVYISIEQEGTFDAHYDALTVMRTENGISIRNF